jgi:hypothetical protein
MKIRTDFNTVTLDVILSGAEEEMGVDIALSQAPALSRRREERCRTRKDANRAGRRRPGGDNLRENIIA